ncbi:hypothetical protein GCM10010251_59070 [Streptomyces aurantiogriseus]|uniref:Uncharacterized protein n=1 Tax=Streptomyces aurantiogriseus TaxID=66870 RepID=A0A918FFM3_9ACTN|nr:hypothetical protein GCM10010251_59070 [Streptomyces aurantiogriseus]
MTSVSSESGPNGLGGSPACEDMDAVPWADGSLGWVWAAFPALARIPVGRRPCRRGRQRSCFVPHADSTDRPIGGDVEDLPRQWAPFEPEGVTHRQAQEAPHSVSDPPMHR